MIILCFVIKVENYAVGETTSSSTKSSMKNSLDDFCTTTINNSLNCKRLNDVFNFFFILELFSPSNERWWKKVFLRFHRWLKRQWRRETFPAHLNNFLILLCSQLFQFTPRWKKITKVCRCECSQTQFQAFQSTQKVRRQPRAYCKAPNNLPIDIPFIHDQLTLKSALMK